MTASAPTNTTTSGLTRIAGRRAKVGLVAGGLGAYWPQFPDLLPQLRRSAAFVADRMRALDALQASAGRRTGTSWRGPRTWQRFSASIGSAKQL